MLPTKSVTSSEEIYRYVKDLVMYRDIDTRKRFPVRKIAQELGISDTPVYSALRRLEGEGFLQNVENSGHFVVPLTEERMAALYERVERSICWPLRKGPRHVDDGVVVELERSLNDLRAAPKKDYRALANYIGKLYSIMAAPCGNRDLRAGAQYINDHLRFPRALALRYFTDFLPAIIVVGDLFLEMIEGNCHRRLVVATLRSVSAQIDRERGYANILGSIVMLQADAVH